MTHDETMQPLEDLCVPLEGRKLIQMKCAAEEKRWESVGHNPVRFFCSRTPRTGFDLR